MPCHRWISIDATERSTTQGRPRQHSSCDWVPTGFPDGARGPYLGSVVDSGSDSEKGRTMSESSDSDCDFGGGGFLDLMDECDEVKLICMLGYID